MQVGAFRHGMQERAQRGVILARRFELRRGDNRVQFAREEDKAEQENERRQKMTARTIRPRKIFAPAALSANAKLTVQCAELNREDRGVRLEAADIIPPLTGSFPWAGTNKRDAGRHRHCLRGSRGTNIYRVAAA